MENDITSEIKTLADIEKNIAEAIATSIKDDRHKTVLKMKYLNGYSWRYIASKLYYGEDWVCWLHDAV